MNKGAVEKVRIFAYTDKLLQKLNGSVTQPFFLPLNPENYSKNYKIETDNRRGIGNQGTDPRYESTAPEELKLEFILDGTGAIENYHYTDPSKKSVKDQFGLFLKTVYQIEGNIHRPNFLKVHWGEYLMFPCILSNLDVNYQLFESNGDPLRIKISATFLNYIASEERAARARLESPDLTHVRETKAGDRLDLITHDIYNNTKYLLQVAQVNGLTTFRQLDSGMKLRFPPINKAPIDKAGA
ncbi:hypothetical protein [Nitrosomonas sp.]|uniref:CIS tube protein n=1 Tax=Nitrosomonas sp. TaxID=42353 RepID=UPI0026259A7D|nr:hypothetical protein [Nitrosomonas sp.]MCW5599977.1 hypothetical protein [Nitrosomonas sp.]